MNKHCYHPSIYTKRLEKSTDSSTETGIPDIQPKIGNLYN